LPPDTLVTCAQNITEIRSRPGRPWTRAGSLYCSGRPQLHLRADSWREGKGKNRKRGRKKGGIEWESERNGRNDRE